jgi:hypothetical protein
MLVGVTSDPVLVSSWAWGWAARRRRFCRRALQAAPLTDQDVDAMVNGSRAARLLGGFRGKPPADVAALRDLVLRVSMLADACRRSGTDLNPVMVCRRRGCRIVDARVRLGTETPQRLSGLLRSERR